MNLKGPEKWDQYVLEKTLQTWYKHDPSLAPDTAVKGIIWLQQRFSEERISDESKYLSDTEKLLNALSTVAKSAIGSPLGKVFAEAATEVNKELFDRARKELSGLDQRVSLQDRTNTMAQVAGQERKITLDSRQMGRENALFKTAHNSLFMAANGVTLNAGEDKILEANPELRNHVIIRDLINTSTDLIRDDVKDAEGRIVLQVKNLNDLVAQEFSGVRVELDGIRAAIKDCNDLQLAHFATYVANETVRQEAEKAAAERQLRLDAAKSGVYLLSTFVGMADQRLGRELYEVGTATIQVAESLTGWAKTISALKDLANPTALLSTVVMGGNVVAALMSLAGNQGRTEFDLVRDEIIAVRRDLASLRDEMHRRFDRIDEGLDALFGQIFEIRATLQQLETIQHSLNRFESTMYELASETRDDELWEKIGLTLDWREKFPDVGEMPQSTFIEANAFFHNWAMTNSRDAAAIGTEAGRRLVEPDSWLTEATKYPLETNLNYFDQFAADRLKITLYPTSPVASPKDWGLAARAYLNLNLDWPQYARQVAASRFDEIERVGQEIRDALHSVAVNDKLFPSLMETYRSLIDGDFGLCQAVAAAEKRFYAAFETHRALNQNVLWQPEGSPLPPSDQVPGWQNVAGRSEGTPALSVPDNATASALLSAQEARAWRMRVIDVRARWDANWVNRADVMVSVLGIKKKIGESGQLRVTIHVEYKLENTNDYVPLRQIFYTFPQRVSYLMPYQGVIIPAAKFTSGGWDTGVKSAFQAGPVQRFNDPAAEARILSAFLQKRQAIQGQLAYTLAVEDAEVKKRINRLTGLVEIVRAFVQLGLPRALDSDEKLQSLLYGKERLPDAPQLEERLANPQSPASLQATLIDLGNSRSQDLERILAAHQEQVRTGTYQEHYRLVDTTLTQLRLAKDVIYVPSLPPGSPDDGTLTLAGTVPDSVVPAARFNVPIEVTNNGTTTWTREAGYSLDVETGATAADGAVAIETLDPKRSTQRTISLIAPPTTGRTAVTLRLTRRQHGWFGTPLTLTVFVTAPEQRKSCHYLVRPGDTYWAIAKGLLGDGQRHPDVQALNPGTTVLHAGDRILVPWEGGEYVYSVVAGGTFWSAARAAYGRADQALVATVVAWNGGDEHRTLKVGDVLYCPR
jgi:hypothetical protein